MLQITVRKLHRYYSEKNRWWIPVLAGLAYSLCLPPFNHHSNILLAPFPLLAFVVLLPLFAIASGRNRARALRHSYLYCFSASLGLYYWIGFVTAEGLWIIILAGTALLCAYFATIYWVLCLAFRAVYFRFPRLYILLFPACWVLVEYGRTLGEISFPWALLGYAAMPMLPLAQLASLTGVFGLSYLFVLGNTLVWHALVRVKRGEPVGLLRQGLIGYAAMLVVVTSWGAWRLLDKPQCTERSRVSCVQANHDQLHWGNRSLDTSFAVVESLVYTAAADSPDCIIMSESALLCYLDKRPNYKRRVLAWSDSVKRPMVTGALDWVRPKPGSNYDYDVYNTSFLIQPGSSTLVPYYKMRLLPFSEALPFEGVFPILSRVNLGEADFKTGTIPVVFPMGDKVRAVPLICYEVCYPEYVRDRLDTNANMLLNTTNDGWFGRSQEPFQHESMSAMRCIENGVTMVRCANSGITTIVNQYGQSLGRTSLYTRAILTRDVPLCRYSTLYSRWGDWPVRLSLLGVIACLVVVAVGLAGAALCRRRSP